MGQRGPAPKRDAERRRRNVKEVETQTVDLSELVVQDVDIPVANDKWHPSAISWYNSLLDSGQSVFYEASEWMTAYLIAEQISLELTPREVQVGTDAEGDPVFRRIVVPMAGAKLNAFLKSFTMLMIHESDRRRLSIELQRAGHDETPTKGNVTNISDKRRERLA